MAASKKTSSSSSENLKDLLEPITQEVAKLRVEIGEIKKTVGGNGNTIGLDEQVRNNRRDIEEIKKLTSKIVEMDKTLDRIDDNMKFQNKIAAVFFVAGGSYIVVEIIKFLLRGITS